MKAKYQEMFDTYHRIALVEKEENKDEEDYCKLCGIFIDNLLGALNFLNFAGVISSDERDEKAEKVFETFNVWNV